MASRRPARLEGGIIMTRGSGMAMVRALYSWRTMIVWVILLMMNTSCMVARVRGEGGCSEEDMAKVRGQLAPCLQQFYVPAAFAIPQEASCCANSTSACCHGLRASLPLGDDCICDFMMESLDQLLRADKPFLFDVPSALALLSSQCSVDFGLSSGRQCGNRITP